MKDTKVFAGKGEEDFCIWWKSVDCVIKILGDVKILLKGEALIPWLGSKVREGLGSRLVGFGSKDIEDVEKILREIFLKDSD
jgi:hypothetical protein